MKVWEMYRNEELKNVEKIEMAIKRDWEEFSKTGICKKISCLRCPFLEYGKERTCKVRKPNHDVKMAKKLLNEVVKE